MSLFLTSDHHFGHQNIISFCNRPYRDITDMNRSLVDNWNDVVQPGDDVWVLGDFLMGNFEESSRLVKQLHGSITLIPGNHDRCWIKHTKYLAWRQKYLDIGIHHISDPFHMYTDRFWVEFNHFPFRTSDMYERYHIYRPINDGQWLFHGHVHDSWRRKDRMVNVGVDVWHYAPVSFDHLMSVLELEDA